VLLAGAWWLPVGLVIAGTGLALAVTMTSAITALSADEHTTAALVRALADASRHSSLQSHLRRARLWSLPSAR
jgi:hypothetical protein